MTDELRRRRDDRWVEAEAILREAEHGDPETREYLVRELKSQLCAENPGRRARSLQAEVDTVIRNWRRTHER